MNILIPGGSGFVGRELTSRLLAEGHTVSAIGSSDPSSLIEHENFHYLQADTSRQGPWQDTLVQADTIINLTGRTVSKRWTKRYKQMMVDSRILTTRHIVESLQPRKGVTLLSASAVGFYGDRHEDVLTESEQPGSDFLARLSVDWEAEALKAEEKGIRVVIARFGIVLGKGGGALLKMLPAFKSFAGGPLGSGTQWFPWIHMADLMGAVDFVLKNEAIKGPVNFCSPNPVRNKAFAKSLGKAIGRPALFPVPAFVLRAGLGQMASAMLASQRVVPEMLSKSGFQFRYADIDEALADILG